MAGKKNTVHSNEIPVNIIDKEGSKISEESKFGEQRRLGLVESQLIQKKLVEGCLRINQKNFLDAYVTVANEPDIYIKGVINRNTALEGDIVAVQLQPREEWKILSEELVELLTADQSFAENFFKKIDESSFNQWQLEKKIAGENDARNTKTANASDNNDAALCLDESNACNAGSSNNLSDKSSNCGDIVHRMNPLSSILNGTNATIPGASKVIKTNENENIYNDENINCPTTIGLPPELELKLKQLNEIKEFHKGVIKKAKSECNRINIKDVTLAYDLKAAFDESLNRSSESNEIFKNISDKKPCELSKLTVVQVILRLGLLTINNIKGFTELLNLVQKTGKVVCIMQYVHPRQAIGILKSLPSNNRQALFSPNDSRLPRMKIKLQNCPPDLSNYPEEYLMTLFLARIIEWSDPCFACGELVMLVGSKNSFEVEKKCLLIENAIDDKPFTKIETKTILHDDNITDEELEGRKDLRDVCVFTIDPSTAKDLDDAVSCVPLSNDVFEVGVHIADVTHYFDVGSPIDEIAARRATTVYLSDQVVPMLPAKLSETICSLGPAKDKLTFSVIWKIDAKGKKLSEWIGKAVINSCCKLSYDHAQTMIENKVEDLKQKLFPKVYGGKILSDIHASVNNLNKIAILLRKERIRNGCLRLDQAKFGFVLNPETHLPEEIYFCELRESNKLIEEFMLKANISVSKKIYHQFPRLSLLRQHYKPHLLSLQNMCKVLELNNVKLKIKSSKTLYNSIKSYRGHDEASDALSHGIMSLCTKPMQLAKYFCSGLERDKKMFHHYALNEQIYTHFTSPIRRYADVMVHRLLASAVNPDRYGLPDVTPSNVQKQAAHCNNKKKAAKRVQESSAELHLTEYIKQIGGLEERGIVVGVLDKAFDVLLLRYAIVKRCYCDQLPLKKFQYKPNIKPGVLNLIWSIKDGDEVTQDISLFTLVKVKLETSDKYKIRVKLICPQ